MTGRWTDEDTRALRAQGRCLDCAVDPSLAHDHSAELEQRAADEIERLQFVVARYRATLEAIAGGGVWNAVEAAKLTLEFDR